MYWDEQDDQAQAGQKEYLQVQGARQVLEVYGQVQMHVQVKLHK